MGDFAVFVQHKRAALDAEGFFAVKLFQLDHVKQFADGFFFVAQQFKLEALFGAEILMRFDTVARNADNGLAQCFELFQSGIEIQAFGGTAGRAVFRIKIDNQRQMFGGVKIATGRRWECELIF